MFSLKFLGEDFDSSVENLGTSSKQGFSLSENADVQKTSSLNIFSNEQGFSHLKAYWEQIKKIDIDRVNQIQIYENDTLILELVDIQLFDANYSINIFNNNSNSNQNEIIQITYK